MTMMARTVPQRRCNVSHTPQHILLSLNQVRNYSKSL
jgi:hypothetical protein